MSSEQQQLEAAIAALEVQRPLLGEVVDEHRRGFAQGQLASGLSRKLTLADRSEPQAVSIPLPRRGGLHRLESAPRYPSHQRSDGRRSPAARPPSSRLAVARSCSTPATTSWAFGADGAAEDDAERGRPLRPGSLELAGRLAPKCTPSTAIRVSGRSIGIHTVACC